MSDGWTGIKIEDVKNELDSFEESMNNIDVTYSTAYDLFNDELSHLWASDKAIDFNEKLIALSNFSHYFDTVRYKIISSAAVAASYMASHNGASFEYDVKSVGTSQKTHYHPLLEEIDGIKGMNIPLAKMSLNSFEESSQMVVNLIAELPLNFSLLDPSGELLAEYKNLINILSADLTEDINQAFSTLRTVFEEETLQITLGRIEAEDAISNRSNTSLGEQLSQRYVDDWNNYADGINDTWNSIGRGDKFFSSVVGSTLMAVDTVVDTWLAIPNSITYVANGLLDVGSSDVGFKTSKDYFEHLGQDFSENWDMLRNASTIDEGILGALVGTGETVLDVYQAVINTADSFASGVGNCIRDAVEWAGNWLW